MTDGNTSWDQGNISYRIVDVISLKTCDKAAFCERYLQPGIPCVIEDLVTEWPAFHKWDKDYLKQTCGGTRVFFHHETEGRTDFARPATQTTLSDFMVRIENGEPIRFFSPAHPVYDFVAGNPIFTDDVRPRTFAHLLPGGRFIGLDRLDARFWPWLPPFPPQLYVANAGSLSPGHYDEDLSHTFHCCFWGNKSVKLFADDPRSRNAMRYLSDIDLSQPLDSIHLKRHPELAGLSGWSAWLHPGQVLFIPSRMWHWFKYEELSLAYVVRARSFNSWRAYSEFARGPQGPPNTFPTHADLWRRVSWRERGLWGNLLVTFERPIILGTWVVMKALYLYFLESGRLRRVVSWLVERWSLSRVGRKTL
ncbi:cupin-like domain-containing protein [Candidatus Thiosymbion oneisti]|uniref:cupin-like domain-containing protein n=1 Tax=Candidatus Thiosymbion oneisti TaxID=589554 RepID=UPI00159F1B3A|nr:cupin-like domain-containing protein [Candidatus Thiosymbion oneisti]